jgi:hypothetical protein
MADKTKKIKGTKAVASTGTKTLHLESHDSEHHAVGIWNLHVMLFQEGKFWVAQGVEIDYVVQGDSIEEAKKNFEVGLEATIDLNLRMYGHINGLLIFAPNELLQEAAKNKGSLKVYSQVTTHYMSIASQRALPFDGIRYLVAKASTDKESACA